jgi:putative DNA primase/helicase
MVLAPIIPAKGLVMLYAFRGGCKTHVAHGIAAAVGIGGQFLKWQAPKARKVLLVDGELPTEELQARLRQVTASMKVERGMLEVLAADLVHDGVGNFADPKTQNYLDPYLKTVELLILDNLSSLTTVIRDNDAESWGPIQAWLLRLRRRGISVLIVHHAGKDGAHRGTSRREDVLDTSLSLRRPSDYDPTQPLMEPTSHRRRHVRYQSGSPFTWASTKAPFDAFLIFQVRHKS